MREAYQTMLALIAKAGEVHDGNEAMKYTQAALNAANALRHIAESHFHYDFGQYDEKKA